MNDRFSENLQSIVGCRHFEASRTMILETDITKAVLATFGGDDGRLREVMTSLVRHLHDFARDVRLTPEEMHVGIEFLNAVVATNSATHNETVLLSDVLGLSSLVCSESQYDDEALLGPFWRMGAPLLANGATIDQTGTGGVPLYVEGEAVDPDGGPIEGVEVHVWQASPVGLYENQDPDQAEMNLRGRFMTDVQGRFAFHSIMPAGYPVPTHGPVGGLLRALGRHPMRPAHLHIMLYKPGRTTLITQMFVDDDEYLASDAVFGVKPALVGGYRPIDPDHPDAGFRLHRRFVLVPGEAILPTPHRMKDRT
ncbi:dioxygenase [Rhizorhabdus histidinilytica]